MFRLFSVSAEARERLRLSNYLDLLERVINECLTRSVYRSGKVHLMYTHYFVAYLGGNLDMLGGVNRTRIGDNVEAV